MHRRDLTIDEQLHEALRRALHPHPELVGAKDGKACAATLADPRWLERAEPLEAMAAPEPAVHVQVQHRWVCVSRLVNRVSCCREPLAWSAGWVVRRFDAVAARPIGIEDRRHSCGRTPDAVDVTDRFHPDEETVASFSERIVADLLDAWAAATARTRAGYRGAAVAVDRRTRSPQVVRRDFHLRTLEL